MNRIKNILTLAMLFVAFILGKSNEYYIAESGDDNADGKTQQTAFKTIEKLNSIGIKAGDKILFKSGDTFHGTVEIKNSGQENDPIIISSYGEGESPIIIGAMTINDLEKTEGNIYKAACEKDISYLYVNNRLFILARYPNSGFLNAEDGGAFFIKDYGLDFDETNMTGAIARVLFNPWRYLQGTIKDISGNLINLESPLYTDTTYKRNKFKPGTPYYLDNSLAFLDSNNEWYYSKENNMLHVKYDFTDEPKVEGSYIDNAIVLDSSVSFINIEGLAFRGQSKNAIIGRGFNNHIKIIDNEFKNIGLNAIYFKRGGEKILVKNNKISDVLGNGIRAYETKYSVYENNQIKRIGMVGGYGVIGLNGASGICILNFEKDYEDPYYLSHHNEIKGNYLDSIGYNGIRFEGYNTVCEKNVVKNVLLTKTDGGCIYTWALNHDYSFDNIIRGNVVTNIQKEEYKGIGHNIEIGIYVDNSARDIVVEDNVIYNIRSGIMVNSRGYGAIIKNNTIYDTEVGVNLIEWNRPDSLNANKVVDNTILTTKSEHFTICVGNHKDTTIAPKTIDNNIHVSLSEKYFLKKITVDMDQYKMENFYSLNNWQEKTNFDKNSKRFVPGGEKDSFKSSLILVNEEKKPKTIELDQRFDYIDINGNELTQDVLTLEPLKAKILFKQIKELK